jgi:hypothetical protein
MHAWTLRGWCKLLTFDFDCHPSAGSERSSGSLNGAKMRKMICRALAGLALLGGLALHPARADVMVAGVPFNASEKVGVGETVLNGVGGRGVMMLNAYAMGLYLPSKQATAAEAYQAKGAKRIRVVLLMGAPAERLAQSLVRGIEKNHDDGARAKLQARLDVFKAAVVSVGTAKTHDVADFDWLPNEQGGVMRFLLNGKQYGADIEGEDFYQAVMSIWLGERPADRALKANLLGQDAAAALPAETSPPAAP